jgi:hypothetical protein
MAYSETNTPSGCVEASALISSLRTKLQRTVDELAALKALSKVGTSESSVVVLLSELRDLKGENQFLSDNNRVGVSAKVVAESAKVLDCIEEERVVLLSFGREAGVLEGALIRMELPGALAKVVESRPMVCAAVVQNSFKGKLAYLVGTPAQLSAR